MCLLAIHVSSVVKYPIQIFMRVFVIHSLQQAEIICCHRPFDILIPLAHFNRYLFKLIRIWNVTVILMSIYYILVTVLITFHV